MTFAERMKEFASRAGDAVQDFASKAGDTAQDIGAKGLQASKELISKAGDTAQDIGAKGLQASKELISKVGDTAQDIGEKGKLTLEIKRLEFKAQKLTTQLGAEVYTALVEQKLSAVSSSTPAIQDIIQEITTLQHEIDKKEAELKD
ncbi:MAG: hypothetical protein LBB61_01150 [Treponema sp.]|jgi:general stress protein YciG|nr:hypothetical protein [Treponema sp.]